MEFYAVDFSFLFFSFSCPLFYSQVRTRNYDSAQLSRADSFKAVVLLIAHWSFRCPFHVNWPLYVKKAENTNQSISRSSSRERTLYLSWSIIVRAMARSFLIFFLLFFFNDGTTGFGKENCASLHVTYRKFMIIFKSVELEHTPSRFPQPKILSWVCDLKKKKLSHS